MVSGITATGVGIIVPAVFAKSGVRRDD